MAKDHYLPAAFIGRFSLSTATRIRERAVWTYNSKAKKLLLVAPSAIGHRKGLYNTSDGNTVDKWKYEDQLGRVLDSLAHADDITLDDWIHVAVPFAAGLFVRGREFNERYESMPLINELQKSGLISPDNTNVSRILRLQRQLAPVAAARWVVLHNQGGLPLVSNDLGLVLTQNLENGEAGWAIPIDTKTILGIFPRKFREIATYRDDRWYADIEHLYPNPTTFSGFNHQIARSATEFIFGPDEDSVKALTKYVDGEGPDLPIVMEAPWSKMFSREELIAHEADWRAVASIANLNLTPDTALEHNFSFNDLDLKDKWFPPVLGLATNLTAFPSGVGFHDNKMCLNLNLLDDFESHIIGPNR
jgi:hypothetical protein